MIGVFLVRREPLCDTEKYLGIASLYLVSCSTSTKKRRLERCITIDGEEQKDKKRLQFEQIRAAVFNSFAQMGSTQ